MTIVAGASDPSLNTWVTTSRHGLPVPRITTHPMTAATSTTTAATRGSTRPNTAWRIGAARQYQPTSNAATNSSCQVAQFTAPGTPGRLVNVKTVGHSQPAT